MKKILIIIITLTLISISNILAKTIWIIDNTNNHSSMVTFYNALIEDLKLSHYKQYIKTVTDNKQIKEKVGDIIILLNGQGISPNTDNITYFFWTGCSVDKCDNWAFRKGRGYIFSDEYIYKQSRLTRIDIIEFLDEWF